MNQIGTYEVNGPTQARFHASNATFRLLLGALGSGKTLALIWEDIMLALEYPGSLGVIYRKEYPQLRDSTKRDYLLTVPHELIKNEVKSEGREELEFVNGSRRLFRCLDNFKKLGSMQFDSVGVDEAWEIDESSFTMLAFGRLRGKIGPRRMMLATNPPDEDHFLHTFFVDEAGPDREVFHMSTYDNAKNLPPGYIARMETRSPQWKRKFLYGHWGVYTEGAGVFEKDFVETRHVDDLKPLPNQLVIRGWDFGWTHPACVWLQIDTQEQVAVVHELLGKDEPLRKFARRVIDETARIFGPNAKVEDYCDHAGNQKNDRGPTACQILANEFGIPTFSRKMGINQGVEGIRWLLQNDLLKIDRSCRWLSKGFFGGYAIDPKTDEPVKNSIYKHLFDALRYALVPKILRAHSIYEHKRLPPTWRRAV